MGKEIYLRSELEEVKKLGHGGFGSVFRAKLRNHYNCAIKICSAKSPTQQQKEEFLTEVVQLSKKQSKYIVNLIGVSFD